MVRLEDMNRPVTKLFMLTSVDGKISTGFDSLRDFDTDIPLLNNASIGLSQYYELEKQTDLWCMCTGKTKEKIGINNMRGPIKKVNANIVIIDNVHLSGMGVMNLAKQYNLVVLFTKNKNHPGNNVQRSNLLINTIPDLTVEKVLEVLKKEHKCHSITIQTGSMTNAEFIHSNLIDYVELVVAPIIVGGDKTPSLVGGTSIEMRDELSKISEMKLIKCEVLKHSYIHLVYETLNC